MTIPEFKASLSLPAIAAPMFLVSGIELVAATCCAGIAGAFPSLNGRTTQDFESMLQELTTRLNAFEKETGQKPAPYCVNLIVNKTNPRLMPDLELCVRYKVPVVITSLGAAKEVVAAVHQYGGLVFHDVINRRHSEKAIEAGADGIIAVTVGAGGHAGTANPFALIAEIRSFYDGLLLLAGAMNTGADIAAALCMGADLAYMGTRFIATKESLADPAYKEMLVQAQISDILYTAAVSGVHANFLKPSLTRSGLDLTQKKQEDFAVLVQDERKAWKDFWSAGQGATGIHDIPGVATLIERLKSEYSAALRNQAERWQAFQGRQ